MQDIGRAEASGHPDCGRNQRDERAMRNRSSTNSEWRVPKSGKMTVEDAFAQPASDVTARLVPDEHPFGRLEQPLPEIRDSYSPASPSLDR
jgi:hypothetical protein